MKKILTQEKQKCFSFWPPIPYAVVQNYLKNAVFTYAACRTEVATASYWIALYKNAPTVNSTSWWFDGNPSTFRSWAPGEPDETNRCFAYNADGFMDTNCSLIHMFTCKQQGTCTTASTNQRLLMKQYYIHNKLSMISPFFTFGYTMC